MKRYIVWLFVTLFCVSAFDVVAGQLLLDQGRRVAGLWVFPELGHPNRFYYAPARAHVAVNEKAEPLFSFTFFVFGDSQKDSDTEDKVNTIGRADGGAIVHLMVEYDTPAEMIETAQTTLREELKNDSVEIMAPILYDRGEYSVVSSTLTDGQSATSMLAADRAPVMEGSRIPLSFKLTPEAASILLASFQSMAPDLSVVFNLEFSGLSDAFDAEMVIDWEKTRKSMDASLGGTIYVVTAKAEYAIDEAVQDGAIKLKVNGDDVAMEKLIEVVHSKALELMFQPISIKQAPPEQQDDLSSAISSAISGLTTTALSASGMGSYSVNAGFRLNDLRSEGQTRLAFDKRVTLKRSSVLTANVGALYNQYGEDARYFKVVNVGGDMTFAQRKVFVTVDGALAPEFESYVESVLVSLRKLHDNGQSTLQELRIDARTADITKTQGPLVYGGVGDTSQESWRHFEYKTSCSSEAVKGTARAG